MSRNSEIHNSYSPTTTVPSGDTYLFTIIWWRRNWHIVYSIWCEHIYVVTPCLQTCSIYHLSFTSMQKITESTLRLSTTICWKNFHPDKYTCIPLRKLAVNAYMLIPCFSQTVCLTVKQASCFNTLALPWMGKPQYVCPAERWISNWS